MRILGGLLLLVTALINLLAGLTYAVGGALTAGITASVGQIGQGLADQYGIPLDGNALGGLDAATDAGFAISGGLFGLGVFLLASVLVLLVGAVFVFKRTKPKVVYAAGGMAIAGEVAGILIGTFGISNVIGLLAGLLAILAARGFAGGPVSAAKDSPKKAKSAEKPAVKVSNDEASFGIADAALAGVVLLGLALMGWAGLLYFERGSGSPMDATAATRMPTTTPAPPATTPVASAPQPIAQASPESSASGSIRGASFTVERVEIENGVLKLIQGQDFFGDASFEIFLFVENNALPEGRTFTANGESGGPAPHIYVGFKPAGKDMPEKEVFMSDYTMNLAFGQRDGITLPGTIRLQVPDEAGSHVEGSFVAKINGWAELLSPEEYTPDLTENSFDILKYLARAHLHEINSGRSVEVLGYSDTSFGTHGNNGGSGSLSAEFRVDDGTLEKVSFEFERDENGWRVSETES
jgi:hypothetical protein